jgi:hypothetical protein
MRCGAEAKQQYFDECTQVCQRARATEETQFKLPPSQAIPSHERPVPCAHRCSLQFGEHTALRVERGDYLVRSEVLDEYLKVFAKQILHNCLHIQSRFTFRAAPSLCREL